jgi:hypothetical protein
MFNQVFYSRLNITSIGFGSRNLSATGQRSRFGPLRAEAGNRDISNSNTCHDLFPP